MRCSTTATATTPRSTPSSSQNCCAVEYYPVANGPWRCRGVRGAILASRTVSGVASARRPRCTALASYRLVDLHLFLILVAHHALLEPRSARLHTHPRPDDHGRLFPRQAVAVARS